MKDLFQGCLLILALSLATSTTSVALAKARVFAEFRQRISAWGGWWHDLIHCPFCLSHWISLALVLVYRPVLLEGRFPVLDLLVSVFVVVALATVWSKQLCCALSTMDGMAEKNAAKL